MLSWAGATTALRACFQREFVVSETSGRSANPCLQAMMRRRTRRKDAEIPWSSLRRVSSRVLTTLVNARACRLQRQRPQAASQWHRNQPGCRGKLTPVPLHRLGPMAELVYMYTWPSADASPRLDAYGALKNVRGYSNGGHNADAGTPSSEVHPVVCLLCESKNLTESKSACWLQHQVPVCCSSVLGFAHPWKHGLASAIFPGVSLHGC